MGIYKRGVVISGVVSLTMGNSALPFADRFVAHAQPAGQLELGQTQLTAEPADQRAGSYIVHLPSPPNTSISEEMPEYKKRSVEFRRFLWYPLLFNLNWCKL